MAGRDNFNRCFALKEKRDTQCYCKGYWVQRCFKFSRKGEITAHPCADGGDPGEEAGVT